MARERRKARNGRVIKNTMDKTVVVAVEWRQRHLLYKKSIRRVTKFYVHDGQNVCRLGDLVRIEETRPISRLKRWRVERILERKEVAEVKPIELEQSVLEEVAETTAPEVPEAALLEADGAELESEGFEEDELAEDELESDEDELEEEEPEEAEDEVEDIEEDTEEADEEGNDEEEPSDGEGEADDEEAQKE